MTLQELFDIVWERAKYHRRAMSTPDIDQNMYCTYRNEHGCCCFLGAAIPPDKYDPAFDHEFENPSKAMHAVMVVCGLDESLTSRVSEIQRIHDRLEPEEWADRLRAYAKQHDLTVPEEPVPA